LISFLIPTYNYNARPLVYQLDQLAQKEKIKYEIIVNDDGSDEKVTENQQIDQLENCSFYQNKTNLGRAGNINQLISRSKYRYCLLMDCDVRPFSADFLSKYIQLLQPDQFCFGGITYDEQKPEKGLLRWKYGIHQEARGVTVRRKNPYRYLLTSNLLFDKQMIDERLFDDQLTTYGYEDLLLAQKLKEDQIPIHHIDNPVVHKNLETSIIYLQKTETALITLADLVQNDKIDKNLTGVSYWGNKMRSLGLAPIVKLVFNLFKNNWRTNILGNKPYLVLFKLYKLGFYLKQF